MTDNLEALELDVAVDGGGTLRARVRGQGPPVLLLHGGPGLSATYVEPLADELVGGYRVASYQQRGLPPSTARGPYDVGVQADDVVAVLDALAWDRAVAVGHSWGGHLLLHVLAAYPDRLEAAVMVDPLGGVGDGGLELFAAELLRRVPQDVAARVTELEARLDAGVGTEAEAEESLRLIWPAYFADPAQAPPMPPVAQSVEANQETWRSLQAELPGLAARLAGVGVPTVFVHGAASPMPLTSSTDTAEVTGPAARVVVLEDTGHFVWHESPGAVRAAVDTVAAAP
jgi:pimeloyl-ACP methyl ester carboxylesterase